MDKPETTALYSYYNHKDNKMIQDLMISGESKASPEQTNPLIQPYASPEKELIRLEKNTKGYNWEIKLNPVVGNQLTDNDIKRLEDFNNMMAEKFGLSP